MQQKAQIPIARGFATYTVPSYAEIKTVTTSTGTEVSYLEWRQYVSSRGYIIMRCFVEEGIDLHWCIGKSLILEYFVFRKSDTKGPYEYVNFKRHATFDKPEHELRVTAMPSPHGVISAIPLSRFPGAHIFVMPALERPIATVTPFTVSPKKSSM